MRSLRAGRLSRVKCHRCDTRESVIRPPPHVHDERYRRLMKNTKFFSLLLMSLLLASAAQAQSGKPEVPDAPQPQDYVSQPIEITSPANTEASGDNQVISQVRQYPRFPRRPMGPYRGQGYRSRGPTPGLSPLGALIGFGAGAALGAARSQDATGGGRLASGLLVGAISALIGGAVGNAIGAASPLLHAKRTHPATRPGDDDGSDLRADARGVHSKRPVSPMPASPSQSTPVEATAQASLEEPAVP